MLKPKSTMERALSSRHPSLPKIHLSVNVETRINLLETIFGMILKNKTFLGSSFRGRFCWK